ncbi:MAG: hypothetical protein ACK55Z_17360 [bacterium]
MAGTGESCDDGNRIAGDGCRHKFSEVSAVEAL